MGNMWRLASDLTWPIVAYTTGHEFNRSIYKRFYSCQEIHDSGPTARACKVIMLTQTVGYAWRYVRASMTLVGMLPPLSDNGKVLVDGGYGKSPHAGYYDTHDILS
jgi:lysophospholipid hydrolase